MRKRVDFLTVHFGRSGWTNLLVKSIRNLTEDDLQIGLIHVVDNSRDGWIQDQFGDTQGIVFHEFAVDQNESEFYHHDHAASLSRGVAQVDADFLVILDCDAHLIDKRFLSYLATIMIDGRFDAIAAPDARYPAEGLSHPCFLVLNRAARNEPLPFDSRQISSSYFDVGRLIRRSLTERGLQVHVPSRTRPFEGCWGEIFDHQVYHHGSGTFRHSGALELAKQVHPYAMIFEAAVLQHGRFRLTNWERWYIRIDSRIRSGFRRISSWWGLAR